MHFAKKKDSGLNSKIFENYIENHNVCDNKLVNIGFIGFIEFIFNG